MPHPKSILSICKLELCVHLGWTDKERSQPQVVLLDIDLFLPNPPIACASDRLDDTFCYSVLIEHIRSHITKKQFHLIEHLSYEIHTLIKQHVPNPTNVFIHVTKYPNILGLKGGVRFSYQDEDLT